MLCFCVSLPYKTYQMCEIILQRLNVKGKEGWHKTQKYYQVNIWNIGQLIFNCCGCCIRGNWFSKSSLEINLEYIFVFVKHLLLQ
jgi:hypothetical protein